MRLKSAGKIESSIGTQANPFNLQLSDYVWPFLFALKKCQKMDLECKFFLEFPISLAFLVQDSVH